MISIRKTSRILAPVDRTFSFLLDVKNRKKFIPALQEVILHDPLPLRVGSRYTEVAEIAGRQLKTTYKITELQENHRISAKSMKSIFPIRADLILAEKLNHTELTIVLNFKLKGIFLLASGLIKTIVTNQTAAILTKIKNQLEQNIRN